MMPLAADPLARELRETNRRLKSCMDRLVPSPDTAETRSCLPTPEQISGLLAELLRAGESLRSRPPQASSGVEHEIAVYRGQVERLRDLLPSMHSALLAERARLERERECVKAAAEWARASRQTL